MKIVTWNVNSLKARLNHVLRFINEAQPDILMLQELKGIEFAEDIFEEKGYKSCAVTQKTYNGVAILSRAAFEVVHRTLPGFDEDPHARYLEIQTGGFNLINIYLPNGNPAPGEKYDYKLAWMDRLYSRLKTLRVQETPFVIGGDFNVIPQPKDCYSPKAWENDALFMLQTRQAFRRYINLGLTDAYRIFHQMAGAYTFWDYQGGAWPKDHGIRIDHFLLSPEMADRAVNCNIDKIPRGWEKPSDHTPVILEIAA